MKELIILRQSKILQNYLSKAEKRIKTGKGIKHKDFWKKLYDEEK